MVVNFFADNNVTKLPVLSLDSADALHWQYQRELAAAISKFTVTKNSQQQNTTNVMPS